MRYVGILCIWVVTTSLYGEQQPSINWQAKLSDNGGVPLKGLHTLFCSIYQGGDTGVSGSGSLAFSEMSNIEISNGIVDYSVGSGTNLFGGNLRADIFITSDTMFLQVALDSPGNVILPRSKLKSVPFAIKSLETVNAIKRETSTYIATEVTNSATSNGMNLLAAYGQARSLTPNGQPLSALNRAVVLVSPGRYDLTTGQLTLDTKFVDLVGLASNRENQYIFGATNGLGTGVLGQTAGNVHVENLLIQSIPSNPQATGYPFTYTSAAYFPEINTTETVIRNCEFRNDDRGYSFSMRLGIDFKGIFSDCVAGDRAFGSGGFFDFGSASGTFINCKAGSGSFGGPGFTTRDFIPGDASGTFINCSGGDVSFAGGGSPIGTFINCVGGDNSFGGYGGGLSSTLAAGTFTNCTGGNYSFGVDSILSGTLTNCMGGSGSFGGDLNANGTTTNAKLIGCRMVGSSWSGTFSGQMENCYWATGFTCGIDARIYGCTIAGSLDLNSTATGVTGTRAQSILNADSNVFGATNATALNIASPSVR